MKEKIYDLLNMAIDNFVVTNSKEPIIIIINPTIYAKLRIELAINSSPFKNINFSKLPAGVISKYQSLNVYRSKDVSESTKFIIL